MKRNVIGLFVSNDGLSEYIYKKLTGKGTEVYPISFSPCSFTRTEIFQTGDIKGILGYFKKENIKNLVFIGKVPAASIFKEIHPSSDMFLKSKEPLCGENILSHLITFLENEGIRVIPLIEVLEDELAREKIYTEIPPAEGEKKDIKTGFNFLVDIMKYRVGQSVVVKKGMIVAVEGIEGTDEMIRRAGKYCRDFVMVKIAGKGKDDRFDIPVIGPYTIEVFAEAGGRVIAVEAGKTIIFDDFKTVSLCNKKGITLTGIKREEI